jgi:hypothetical protein
MTLFMVEFQGGSWGQDKPGNLISPITASDDDYMKKMCHLQSNKTTLSL